jgi:hypothetical protein
MNPWFIVDTDGFLVDSYYPQDMPELEEGQVIVKYAWQGVIHKAKYDFQTDEWCEGLTQAELDEIHNRPVPPSQMDILGQQLVERELESLDIKTQNDFIGQQLVDMDLRLLQGGM